MIRVKGFVNKYTIQPHAGLVHNGGHEGVYVEEIPESAIRVEAVVENDSYMGIGYIDTITVPAALIGKRVEVIIMEVKE